MQTVGLLECNVLFFWFVTALNCQNNSSHTWSLYKPPSVWNSHVWRAAEEEEARSPHPCAYQSLKCQFDDGQSVGIDNGMWKDIVKRWQSTRKCDSDVTTCVDATSLPPSRDNLLWAVSKHQQIQCKLSYWQDEIKEVSLWLLTLVVNWL